jgi:hypothetical protein
MNSSQELFLLLLIQKAFRVLLRNFTSREIR